MPLGIKWHNLSAMIMCSRLTLFGHIASMDDNADAKRILLASPRWTGKYNQDVPTSCGRAPSNRIWDTTTLLSEAVNMAQNCPLSRMLSTYGTKPSSASCQKQWRWKIT